MKNSLEGFKSNFKQTKERISEPEDKAVKIIESEEEKRLNKSE